MNTVAQEVLVLRQLMALRQRSVPQDQALAMVAQGLPPGSVADSVATARRALSAGLVGANNGELSGILADSAAPVRALELAALAREARVSADGALRLARVYGAVAVAGPLVVGSMLAWLAPGLANLGLGVAPSTVGLGLTVVRWVGIPLAAVLAWAVGRATQGIVPGVADLQRAAVMWTLAARPGGQRPVVAGDAEHAFVALRRRSVGEDVAFGELADVLAARGHRHVALSRAFIPVVLMLLVLWLAMPVLTVLIYYRASGGVRMMSSRLLGRCVAQALSEGIPLGPLLRDGGVGRPGAAALVESGDLASALRALDVAPELVAVADQWPVATGAAHARLDALPSVGITLAPKLATLALLLMTATLQGAVVMVHATKVRPMLLALGAEWGTAPGSTDWLPLVVLGWLMALASGVWGVAQCVRRVRQRDGGPHARSAAVAAALVETGAPLPVVRSVVGDAHAPRVAGAGVAELEGLVARAVAGDALRDARDVVILRVVGFGGLSLAAAGLALELYVTLASLPGGL